MKTKSLYLSYTGMLEPLGRSQVLAYLSRLSNEYSFTLISFEKSQSFQNKDAVAALKAECAEFGIDWKPRLYHKKPRLLATVWDLSVLFWLTFMHSVSSDVKLVHSRSYIPTIAAWLCSKVTRTPFVFDMRALWLDELITAGRLQENTVVYRILRWFEGMLLKDAAAVVSLTEAAVVYLKKQHPELINQKFEVITTCVDLNRFSIRDNHKYNNEALVVGAMGTLLSGWFHLDWLLGFFKQIKKINPSATLKIVTKDDHSVIKREAVEYGLSLEDINILSSTPEDVAKNIKDMDVSAMFFKAEVGKIGSAPTRMGELLACGIPVVGNVGVGDMAGLITRYDVGAIVKDNSEVELAKSANELLDYLNTKHSDTNCRDAAVDYFSADQGAEKYRQIYKQAISKYRSEN